jgi:tetratricopeptide (TPR) repeat protein
MNVEISLSDLKKTKSETKKNIIARFVKNGLLNNAKDLIIKDFKDHSVILTNEEKNNFLNEIGNEFEKQGKFEEAIRCKKSVDSNDVDKISEYLELNNDRDKIRAILNNFWELSNQGKIDDSNALLQEAIVLVNSFSIQYYKCVYLFEIYEKLCNLGRIDEANVLLKQAINVADEMIDFSSKIRSYYFLIKELIRMKKYDQALMTINKAFESDWDNNSEHEIRLKITKIFDYDFCLDEVDEALLFVRQIRFLQMEQKKQLYPSGAGTFNFKFAMTFDFRR